MGWTGSPKLLEIFFGWACARKPDRVIFDTFLVIVTFNFQNATFRMLRLSEYDIFRMPTFRIRHLADGHYD